MEQRFIEVKPSYGGRDGDKLTPLYAELNGMTLGEKEKVLVFVGMKRTAAWLAGEVYRRRIPCSEIHGRFFLFDDSFARIQARLGGGGGVMGWFLESGKK